jgi:hypothetical protein
LGNAIHIEALAVVAHEHVDDVVMSLAVNGNRFPTMCGRIRQSLSGGIKQRLGSFGWQGVPRR